MQPAEHEKGMHSLACRNTIYTGTPRQHLGRRASGTGQSPKSGPNRCASTLGRRVALASYTLHEARPGVMPCSLIEYCLIVTEKAVQRERER